VALCDILDELYVGPMPVAVGSRLLVYELFSRKTRDLTSFANLPSRVVQEVLYAPLDAGIHGVCRDRENLQKLSSVVEQSSGDRLHPDTARILGALRFKTCLG